MSWSDSDEELYESASQVYQACSQERYHRIRLPLPDRLIEASNYLLSRRELVGDDDISFICKHYGLVKDKDSLMKYYLPLYIDMMKNSSAYNNSMMLAFAALHEIEVASKDDPDYVQEFATKSLAKAFKVNERDLTFYYGQARNPEGKKKCSLPFNYEVTFGNFSFALCEEETDDSTYFYPTPNELRRTQKQRKNSLNNRNKLANSDTGFNNNENNENNENRKNGRSGSRGSSDKRRMQQHPPIEIIEGRSRRIRPVSYSDYIYGGSMELYVGKHQVTGKRKSSSKRSSSSSSSSNRDRKKTKTLSHPISPDNTSNEAAEGETAAEEEEEEEEEEKDGNDGAEFIVEAVLADKPGKGGKRSNHTFLVRWEGYTESDDSWLPWPVLKYNLAAHDYLRRNGKVSWIPVGVLEKVTEAAAEEEEVRCATPHKSNRKGEYNVERIVSHRRIQYTKLGEQKTRVEFRVRWEGWDKSFDEWKPYSDLRYNVCLHQYCNKYETLKHLIPNL